ncbi:MAG: dihydrolipoamide dehydrogenase [Gammaproteobacteria bacterium RIFCSPHIGHO2_12_FULL_42_13]|nr:MAG: dihydrolipoamide dehydrogenase [Gammaproteobacteria bacterium RIFCSPHIGHO2_12_FULL_42_13]
MTQLNVDICVIGGGSGGLSVAAGASQMGATVALVESGKMGGDCLNYGCVPSKSLLTAAKVAHEISTSSLFGIEEKKPVVDFAKVMAHVHGVIEKISVHDSVERFTKLGVKVIQAPAQFKDANTVVAGDTTITARRFVIATGSSPAVPPIPGIDKVNFYTNETIFDIQHKPEHLIVIGGGPIGCELAQAFLLLGTKVTVLEAFNILPKDEKDLVAMLRQQLIDDGLVIKEGVKITDIREENKKIKVTLTKEGREEVITGTDLLVAAGRRANVKKLNLEAAGVRYSAKGIEVNKRLQTSNKRVYAVGDVAGSFQFTHIAGYHAGIAVRNILFRLPANVDYKAVPWVTYTDPELAHVGMSTEDALKYDPKAKIVYANFADNDRAQAEHKTLGKIKVVTDKKGKILGATILGPHAGELLLPWVIAIQEGKSIRSMTSIIAPYPTLSEISKRVAGEYYKPLIFSDRVKKIVRFLRYFG